MKHWRVRWRTKWQKITASQAEVPNASRNRLAGNVFAMLQTLGPQEANCLGDTCSVLRLGTVRFLTHLRSFSKAATSPELGGVSHVGLPKTLALESSLGMGLHQSLMSLEERTSLRPAREFHSQVELHFVWNFKHKLEVGAHMFVAELETKGSGRPFLDPSPKSAVPASFTSHKSRRGLTSQASALAAWQTVLRKVLCLRHHFWYA